jgi:hypothetical protein
LSTIWPQASREQQRLPDLRIRVSAGIRPSIGGGNPLCAARSIGR